MPVYQQLATLRSASGFSWSEVHFLSESNIDVALGDAVAWGQRRIALLASTYFLVAVRVSDVAVFRDALDHEYTPAAGQGDFVTGPPEGDELPYDRLNVRIEATPRFRRTWKMGGIASSILASSGAYTPTAEFRAAFSRMSNYLLSRGPGAPSGFYCLQQKGGNDFFQVGSCATIGGLRALTITLAQAEGDVTGIFTRNAQVRLSLVRSGTNVNGTWIVNFSTFNAGATTIFTKPKNRLPYFAPTFPTGGRLTVVPSPNNPLSYVHYTAIQPVRGAARKTRGPFGQSRGRARAGIQI